MSQKCVRRHAHSDTAYLFIILYFTFLVFVFLQIDKINIYDRQTTMRNEIRGLTSGRRHRICKTTRSVLYSLLYVGHCFSLFIVLSFCVYCFANSVSSTRSKSRNSFEQGICNLSFVAKARARETIAHKLVNTRVECSPFVQFIS